MLNVECLMLNLPAIGLAPEPDGRK
jgi:hypothetical protein